MTSSRGLWLIQITNPRELEQKSGGRPSDCSEVRSKQPHPGGGTEISGFKTRGARQSRCNSEEDRPTACGVGPVRTGSAVATQAGDEGSRCGTNQTSRSGSPELWRAGIARTHGSTVKDQIDQLPKPCAQLWASYGSFALLTPYG
jgi:hypothetical protein